MVSTAGAAPVGTYSTWATLEGAGRGVAKLRANVSSAQPLYIALSSGNSTVLGDTYYEIKVAPTAATSSVTVTNSTGSTSPVMSMHCVFNDTLLADVPDDYWVLFNEGTHTLSAGRGPTPGKGYLIVHCQGTDIQAILRSPC